MPRSSKAKASSGFVGRGGALEGNAPGVDDAAHADPIGGPPGAAELPLRAPPPAAAHAAGCIGAIGWSNAGVCAGVGAGGCGWGVGIQAVGEGEALPTPPPPHILVLSMPTPKQLLLPKRSSDAKRGTAPAAAAAGGGELASGGGGEVPKAAANGSLRFDGGTAPAPAPSVMSAAAATVAAATVGVCGMSCGEATMRESRSSIKELTGAAAAEAAEAAEGEAGEAVPKPESRSTVGSWIGEASGVESGEAAKVIAGGG